MKLLKSRDILLETTTFPFLTANVKKGGNQETV